MDTPNSMDSPDKILFEGGLSQQECANMTEEEKKRIASVMRMSALDVSVSGPSISISNSATDEEMTKPASPKALDISVVSPKSLDNSAASPDLIHSTPAKLTNTTATSTPLNNSAVSPKPLNNTSASLNPINNTAMPPKQLNNTAAPPKALNNAAESCKQSYAIASGSDVSKAGPKTAGSKNYPGSAIPVLSSETNNRSMALNSNSRMNKQAFDKTIKTNENGVETAKLSPTKEEEGKAVKIEAKETVESAVVDIRHSPETVEEELLPSLLRIVFEQNKSSAPRFPENILPPLPLAKAEWVKEMSQHFFERKLAKIKTEARKSKWFILSQRTCNISELQKSPRKSPPSDFKDEDLSNSEGRSMEVDNGDKMRNSPENPDSLREPSPETSNAKDEWISKSSGPGRLEITTSTGKSRKTGKLETPPNSPSGKNEDDVNINETEKPDTRRSRKRNGTRKGNSRPMPSTSNMNSPVHDDSDFVSSNPSKYENTTRNYDRDYPSIGGNSSTENHSDMRACPVCFKMFSLDVVEVHAWSCKAVEEERQVAVEENGDDGDIMELEPNSDQKKIFPSGQNENADCTRRLRSLSLKRGGEWLSKEGERPSKNLRK